jgi:hypothetical protein
VIGQRELRLLFSPEINLDVEVRALIAHVGATPTDTPDGWLEISYLSLEQLLGCGEAKVRRAAKKAHDSGWIQVVREGGNGRHPRFRFQGAKNSAVMRRVSDFDTQEVGRVSDLDTQPPAVVGEGGDTNPPIPLPVKLHPRAMEAIERSAGVLEGCRGSLTDYLTERVAPDRQYHYVQTIAGWLQGNGGLQWVNRAGVPVPRGEWHGLISGSLNELGATDEKTGRKHDQGDPVNLRNKLQINIRQWEPNDGRGGASTGADRGAAQRPPGGDGAAGTDAGRASGSAHVRKGRWERRRGA